MEQRGLIRLVRLAFDHLSVAYRPGRWSVEDVTFAVEPGRSVALVGASGAGKSTLGHAALGLLNAATIQGHVRVDGLDLLSASEPDRLAVRGRRVAHAAQDAAGALNPSLRVGDQVAEVVALRDGLGRAARRAWAVERFEEVGLPRSAVSAWPHELSGGQQRRAVLAMALAGDPKLLVADEPTANLDTIRTAEIIGLLRRLQATRGLGLLLITHDLRVAFALADDWAVLVDGKLVEFSTGCPRSPAHPYTRSLIAAAIAP